MTRSTNARLAGSAYLSYIVVGSLNEVLTGPLAGYQLVPAIGLPALIFAPVFALWLLIKGVATPARRETR